MKSKDIILGVCVAVIIVIGQIFLFSANQKKDAALVQLREARTELAQVKSQLDQLKNSSVATLSTENARLRKENQALSQKNSQLQKENNQLRGTSQQLTKQLEATRAEAQQPEEQSPPENQPAAAPAQPAEQRSQTVSAKIAQRNACINNLRQIDMAKQQWALANDKTDDDVPTMLGLLPYFKDGLFPVCPSGGTYTINAVGVPPTCSVPAHVLPP